MYVSVSYFGPDEAVFCQTHLISSRTKTRVFLFRCLIQKNKDAKKKLKKNPRSYLTNLGDGF